MAARCERCDLLFYGDPLVQRDPEGEGGYCVLCKKYCVSSAALVDHLASQDHIAKVSSGLAAGVVTRIPGVLESAWQIVQPRNMARRLSGLLEILLTSTIKKIACSRIVNDAALNLFADRWPHDAPEPPQPGTEPHSEPWSAAASGVVIRECDEAAKGRGAFAARAIKCHAFVGVYLGEQLSQKEAFRRHDMWPSRSGPDEDACEELQETSNEELAELSERAARLSALTEGAPIGGDANRGKYLMELLPASVLYPEACTAYIDAEDPNRSSWARYINHAPTGTRECNLACMMDAPRGRVWFVATRDIAPGEELHFDYRGDQNRWGMRVKLWFEAQWRCLVSATPPGLG